MCNIFLLPRALIRCYIQNFVGLFQGLTQRKRKLRRSWYNYFSINYETIGSNEQLRRSEAYKMTNLISIFEKGNINKIKNKYQFKCFRSKIRKIMQEYLCTARSTTKEKTESSRQTEPSK
jgi:hypothetical protein